MPFYTPRLPILMLYVFFSFSFVDGKLKLRPHNGTLFSINFSFLSRETVE